MRVVPVVASTRAGREPGKPPTSLGSLDVLNRWVKIDLSYTVTGEWGEV